MPWTAPKSTDEVYAVTAFLLNLSGVVPDDFTLSDKNIADVQKRMPNRNGMTTQHAMWPGKEFQWCQGARCQERSLHERLRNRTQCGIVPAGLRSQCARQSGGTKPHDWSAARR